jgi:WD40 repeat protein
MEELKKSRDLKESLKILEKNHKVLVSGHTDAVSCIDCSEDLFYIVTGSNDSSVRVWNFKTFAQINKHHFHLGSITCISISKDNQFIASGSDDKSIAIFSLKTWSLLRTFQGHSRKIRCIKFTSDFKYLVASAADRMVQVFELSTLEPLKKIKDHLGDVSALDTFEDLIVTGDSRGTVHFRRLGEFISFKSVFLQKRITLLKLEGKSQLFAVILNRVISLIDVDSTAVLKTVEISQNVFCLSLKQDTAKFFTENEIFFWNLNDGEVSVRKFEEYHQVSCICVKQDFFVAGFVDRTVKLFHSSGDCKGIMQGHLGYVEIVKVSPDDVKVVTSGDDFTIRFWNIFEKIQEKNVLLHQEQVKSFAFTKNGKFLLSILKNTAVIVWKNENN